MANNPINTVKIVFSGRGQKEVRQVSADDAERLLARSGEIGILVRLARPDE